MGNCVNEHKRVNENDKERRQFLKATPLVIPGNSKDSRIKLADSNDTNDSNRISERDRYGKVGAGQE